MQCREFFTLASMEGKGDALIQGGQTTLYNALGWKTFFLDVKCDPSNVCHVKRLARQLTMHSGHGMRRKEAMPSLPKGPSTHY